MPENTPAVRATEHVLVDPASGEVIDPTSPAPVLIAALDRLDGLETRLAAFRRELELVLVERLDRRGARTAELDGVKLETNAPTEELYDAGVLRDELKPLLESGAIDQALIDELITRPAPAAPPPPRVDRRVVNRLKSSDNPDLVRALLKARTKRDARRTLKVKARAVEGTAVEVRP